MLYAQVRSLIFNICEFEKTCCALLVDLTDFPSILYSGCFFKLVFYRFRCRKERPVPRTKLRIKENWATIHRYSFITHRLKYVDFRVSFRTEVRGLSD